MSHFSTISAEKSPIRPALCAKDQVFLTDQNNRDGSMKRVDNVANLDRLTAINENFCKLSRESRHRSSKERLRMIQNINDASNSMHFRQISGSTLVGAAAFILMARGHSKSSNFLETTANRLLSSLTDNSQSQIREFEIWYQAEQERIARSRDQERAHMQRMEQHLQSEHSTKLRFFS